MRKTTLLWLVLAVICGAGIFRTSQRVHEEHEKIAALNIEITKEQESLRVLNAEWSYLNQPERLEKLSKIYLHLAPLKGGQFVKAEDIPLRGAVVAQAAPVVKEKTAPKPHLALAPVKIKPAPSITDDQNDDNDGGGVDDADDETPAVKSFVRPISPVKSASLNNKTTVATHNFTDLMKNLRSGVE
jgi:hypothetical protein